MERFLISKACALSCAVFAQALAAQSVSPLASALPDLGADDAERVMAGEVVCHDNSSGFDILSLVPEDSALRDFLADAPSGKKGFALASVSFVPCPGDFSNMEESEKMRALYNAIGSVSTQKGITYISRRAGYKPKVLFDESYLIESPESADVPLPDLRAEEVPESIVLFAFQKDSSFGGNVYRYEFQNGAREICARVTNLTAMKYHGVTCLKPEELTMFVAARPAEGGVIVNSAAIVRGHKTKVTVLVAKVDLSDSFRRRTGALHGWLKGRLPQSAPQE